MTKEKIILIGGGGHCKSCIDVIEQQDKFEIAGIVDIKNKIGEEILNYQIIGCDDDLPEILSEYKNCLITIGQLSSPDKRIELYNRARSLNALFPVIKSPSAYISEYAQVREGTIVMHQAIINAGALVGKNCIINTKSLVEHDAIIEDHCHISTASIVNGGVIVGERTFYGSGAVSKQYIKIAPNSFIKANSIVK